MRALEVRWLSLSVPLCFLCLSVPRASRDPLLRHMSSFCIVSKAKQRGLRVQLQTLMSVQHCQQSFVTNGRRLLASA